ncbi:MFS transporter [Hydrogenothermus marinus]|uniref:Nitrate/nitrite transporter NarK n=1 Tax=Hydrogenothermus marinus TaxID=133270 RepID=A0A3M0BL61_9AQUI|nr:MFS transporter [Hydrogenothermus marinus]RMA97174.1 nitrate/nitrite transporter NarK [Hydrogenothermus marinus]
MNRNIVVLGLVSFFTDFATAMINPILPIFVVVILNQSMDKLGIIVAVATFVSYAVRLLSGYIADRFGIVKPLVVAGYVISAISKPLIGFSDNYKSVAFLKAFERLGKAIRSAPKDYMISSFTKKKKYGKSFGFHKTLDIGGELGGTLTLFFILLYFSPTEQVIRNIFFLTIIPGIIGVILVAFFVEDVPKVNKIKKVSFKLIEKDKETVKLLIFYFLFVFFIFNDAFFTVQAKEVGISISIIPLLFVVLTAVQTATSYIFGLAIDKYGAKKILLFAYISGIISELLLLQEQPIYTWFAFAFLGLFTVSSLNANRAFIAKNAKNQGSVYGIFYSGVAVFGAIGAYIVGLIWNKFGMELSIIFSLIGTSFITLLFSIYILRNKNYG